MMDRFRRSWALAKQSFAVLAGDKRLLLFPVMSAIASIFVTAAFILPLFATGAVERVQGGQLEPLHYVVLFAFYYVNYFVVIFFNCALVASANICLSGGHATLGDGLSAAAARIHRIAMWALVAATVGLVLRVVEQRAEKLGRIVAAIMGTAWTLITYFIIPVLAFEDLGVMDSIKRSASLFKKTWGEEIAGGIGFGLIWFLMIIPGVVLIVGAALIHPLAAVAVGLAYFLLLATVAAAVKSIFTVALYRYASAGQVPSGFTPDLVQNAFGPGKVLSASIGQ